MAAQQVHLGVVQLQLTAEAAENDRRAEAGIREAAARGAQIICLPELFRSLYFCQREDHDHFQLAERIPGPSTERFGQLARELGVVLIISLFEKRAEGLYHNTAAVLDADGSYLGKYRKMHIPDDPLFYEKFYFTPGDLGFKVFPSRFGRLGVLICWDQWYPEGARLTALRGADILFYPTAIGWHPSEKAAHGEAQHQSWELIQRSHGVANGCYVVSVNRTGHEGDPEGGIEFWGQSFVSDPQGTILALAPVDTPAVLVVPVDLGKLDVQRTHWPFLRDRRIDAYADITRRFIDE
ncbi:carbon-nitrogen hydrolase [Candidatus Chloroploca sp. M-50]|uniref:Carbon-nitrogen hydrolase n=1 Tax=Candidatus Chloroploca mongolica TaxID=2528176 RepID=A0ABS4D903_9CHLR|nr:carbon-nitrogen hydrolase [Candidatus Chloroploca mongolica]MBP1465928.1 carbon-nitrogen hydrolase [Candidatus Chloroploca mongolica]